MYVYIYICVYVFSLHVCELFVGWHDGANHAKLFEVEASQSTVLQVPEVGDRL